jgi:hypothetical protein
MSLLPDEYWLVTLTVGAALGYLIVAVHDRIDRKK